MPKVVNLVGKRFGKLTVISLVGASRGGSKLWNCKCDCGEEKQVSTRHLNRKNNTIRSCGCLNPNRLKGDKSPWFKGYGKITRGFFTRHITKSAKKRGLSCALQVEITEEYLHNLFEEQEGKCYYSNVVLSLPEKWDDYNYTASIDRTDSSLGYIKGNIKFVHKHINIMKNKFSQEYFIEMCKKVGIKNNKI